MEEAKSYPMAFFTPIVEIAETVPDSKNQTKDETTDKAQISGDVEIKDEKDETLPVIKVESKNEDFEEKDVAKEIKEEDEKEDTKDENGIVIKDEPKLETVAKDAEGVVVNKRKRGRPKKTEASSGCRKSERTCHKKIKIEPDEPKRVKKPRKQRTPKKKPPECNEVEVKYEEDLLISPEHLDEKKVIKCPICKDDKDWNLKEIKEHYKKDHPGKRLRTSRFFGDLHPCDVCGKEFKSAGSLKDHMETHSNYFYCDICNHSTKKILDHILHLRVHHHLGIFQCLMCEFNTLEITKINEHVTNHDDLLKYWCDSCKKSFQILQHFQEHDNYHTGLKPFDCEFCGKCFLYSRYLHAHKINMHKEEMNCPSTYECVICNKIYQHRNSLKLHMNSHTGNFAICDICGKTLSSKEKLKFHLRTHTGYKPYSCQYCGKCFTKKPILVEHVRVHTGEKPYICDFCTKGFSQRSSLVIHMRGHTGEKPYGCQFCGKGFVAKAMLNIHLKTCKGYFQVPKTEF